MGEKQKNEKDIHQAFAWDKRPRVLLTIYIEPRDAVVSDLHRFTHTYRVKLISLMNLKTKTMDTWNFQII